MTKIENLGQIFTKSQNKIQDPAKLSKIIDMINKEQWLMMGVKDKGDIYEGLFAYCKLNYSDCVDFE